MSIEIDNDFFLLKIIFNLLGSTISSICFSD